MHKKDGIEELVEEILDGTQIDLQVDKYELYEDLECHRVNIRCDVHHLKSGQKQTIEGEGVGLIDALFNGFVKLYSSDYPSLKTITFADFSIQARIETGHNSLSDSAAEVTLRVANSDGQEFSFTDVSQSITASSLNTVLLAAEFFCNTERAVKVIYKALQYARENQRPDSVRRYTRQLSTLVNATSYSEVIEQIKADSFT